MLEHFQNNPRMSNSFDKNARQRQTLLTLSGAKGHLPQMFRLEFLSAQSTQTPHLRKSNEHRQQNYSCMPGIKYAINENWTTCLFVKSLDLQELTLDSNFIYYSTFCAYYKGFSAFDRGEKRTSVPEHQLPSQPSSAFFHVMFECFT